MRARSLLGALLLVPAVATADGRPRPAPSVLATSAVPRAPEPEPVWPESAALRLAGYPGGPSLAAWRASPRVPLSVLVSVPGRGLSGFLHPDGRVEPGAAWSDTCVPPSYPWHPVSLAYERLFADASGVVFDVTTAELDPRRCALTTTRRGSARPVAILGPDALPLAYALRRPDALWLLVPRDAHVLVDADVVARSAGVVRLEIPMRPGAASSVLVSYPPTVRARFLAALGLVAPVDAVAFRLDVSQTERDPEPLAVVSVE